MGTPDIHEKNENLLISMKKSIIILHVNIGEILQGRV